MDQILISGKRRLPLNEFHLRTQRIARGLVETGIKEGDSVALLLRNDIAFLEATFGAALIGAYSVPINWHFKEREIQYVLDNCGAKVIVAINKDAEANIFKEARYGVVGDWETVLPALTAAVRELTQA